MKRVVLLPFLLAPCFVSCQKQNDPEPVTTEYDVNLVSSTLTIDNFKATANTDYHTTLTFIKPSDNFRLPGIISVQIDDNTLETSQYSYSEETGNILIPGELIVGDITITAERAKLDGYGVSFSIGSHVKCLMYQSEDYSQTPKEDDYAYARDAETGEMIKDGTGEVNFKLVVDDYYEIAAITVRGLYDDLLYPVDIGEDDIYRINNIRYDLTVEITVKKLFAKNIATYDDIDNHRITLSYETRQIDKIDYFAISVKGGSKSKSFTTDELTYEIAELEEDVPYTITIIPHLTDGSTGDVVTCNRMLTKEAMNEKIPRIEINTENNVWPKYVGIQIGTDYVQSTLKIYKENSVVYDSGDDFEGAKIKVRGNTSSRSEKKGFKIKLDTAADLLEDFRNKPIADMEYQNKNWVLLATHDGLNMLSSKILKVGVGMTINQTLEFPWYQEYTYASLYINNDYRGLYILCESHERGKGKNAQQSRYPVDEDGFVIENDYFARLEDLSLATSLNSRGVNQFTFKYPDTDDLNVDDDNYTYIKDYLNCFESYLANGNEKCFDYFDKTSLARWLLAQDILSNGDAVGANRYIYKINQEETSKLIMGNPWDFDQIENKVDSLAPIRTRNIFYYPYLLSIPSFEEEEKTLYNNYRDSVLPKLNDYLNTFPNEVYDDLLKLEAKRWKCAYVPLDDQKNETISFFTAHLEFLDQYFN